MLICCNPDSTQHLSKFELQNNDNASLLENLTTYFIYQSQYFFQNLNSAGNRISLTWNSAEKRCNRGSGHLPSIRDRLELKSFTELVWGESHGVESGNPCRKLVPLCFLYIGLRVEQVYSETSFIL